MEKIILPINPKYSQLIKSNLKNIEFRKKLPKKKFNVIFIYETAPTSAIIGYCKVLDIKTDYKDKIFNKYSYNGSISYNDFYKYFKNSKFAHAIILDNFISLQKKIKLNFIPQSFVYVKENDKNNRLPNIDNL